MTAFLSPSPQFIGFLSLRETAKVYTTHYSTMIEGHQLKPQEIQKVIQLEGHFPGREQDEHEVKGYYAALCKKWVEAGFLEIVDPGLKSRRYSLAKKYKKLLDT